MHTSTTYDLMIRGDLISARAKAPNNNFRIVNSINTVPDSQDYLPKNTLRRLFVNTVNNLACEGFKRFFLQLMPAYSVK